MSADRSAVRSWQKKRGDQVIGPEAAGFCQNKLAVKLPTMDLAQRQTRLHLAQAFDPAGPGVRQHIGQSIAAGDQQAGFTRCCKVQAWQNAVQRGAGGCAVARPRNRVDQPRIIGIRKNQALRRGRGQTGRARDLAPGHWMVGADNHQSQRRMADANGRPPRSDRFGFRRRSG